MYRSVITYNYTWSHQPDKKQNIPVPQKLLLSLPSISHLLSSSTMGKVSTGFDAEVNGTI